MCALRRLSIIDQTMEHIRSGIASGRWKGRLPGVRPLSVELGVSRETLRTALHRLETEGTLAPGGTSSPREIRSSIKKRASGKLRVVVLVSKKLDQIEIAGRTLLLNILHDLEAAGHTSCIVQLPYPSDEPSPAALARLVREKNADAWIIFMGALSTIEWFSRREEPALALGGRARGVNIAATGSLYDNTIAEATRHLIALGHRRIVYVTPKFARKPSPSGLILAFEKELRDAGIPVGAFNMPDWEESPIGFRNLLESLFKITPPTAMIVWNSFQVSAVLAFLNARQLKVPDDLSILAHAGDESLAWQAPLMDSPDLHWDPEKISRHVIRWVDAVASGEHSREQVFFSTEFRPTKTIAPPRAVAAIKA